MIDSTLYLGKPAGRTLGLSEINDVLYEILSIAYARGADTRSAYEAYYNLPFDYFIKHKNGLTPGTRLKVFTYSHTEQAGAYDAWVRLAPLNTDGRGSSKGVWWEDQDSLKVGDILRVEIRTPTKSAPITTVTIHLATTHAHTAAQVVWVDLIESLVASGQYDGGRVRRVASRLAGTMLPQIEATLEGLLAKVSSDHARQILAERGVQ